MSNTLGAPSGGATVGGHAGVLSIAFGMITPVKGGREIGRKRLSGNSTALAAPGVPRICWATAFVPLSSHDPPKALASAALAVDTKSCRRFIDIPLRSLQRSAYVHSSSSGLCTSSFGRLRGAGRRPLTCSPQPRDAPCSQYQV